MMRIRLMCAEGDVESIVSYNDTPEMILERMKKVGRIASLGIKNGGVLMPDVSIGEQGVRDGDVLDMCKHSRVVKVFDPLNKQGYLFRYGSEDNELVYTAGLDAHLTRASRKKRIFLCKKFQVKECWAQRKCNGIHACRTRVSELRQLFPAIEDSGTCDAKVEVFSKTDGETFSVLLERVLPTAGLTKLLAVLDAQSNSSASCEEGARHAPRGVLCENISKSGGCFAREACECIHINLAHLKHVRAMTKVPCCGQMKCSTQMPVRSPPYPQLKHGREWSQFSLIASAGAPGTVHDRAMLAVTKGLKELCESEERGMLVVPMSLICRPHQKKMCKWGPDCNNVHVCRHMAPAKRTSSADAKPIGKAADLDTDPPTLAEELEEMPVEKVKASPPVVAMPPVAVLPLAQLSLEQAQLQQQLLNQRTLVSQQLHMQAVPQQVPQVQPIIINAQTGAPVDIATLQRVMAGFATQPAAVAVVAPQENIFYAQPLGRVFTSAPLTTVSPQN